MPGLSNACAPGDVTRVALPTESRASTVAKYVRVPVSAAIYAIAIVDVPTDTQPTISVAPGSVPKQTEYSRALPFGKLKPPQDAPITS
eukprot:4525572-Prymnesium_polylepis.2